MDDLDAVTVNDQELVPLCASRELSVDFDGDSLRDQSQIRDELAQQNSILPQLACFPVDLNLQTRSSGPGRLNNAPQLDHVAVELGADQNRAAPNAEHRKRDGHGGTAGAVGGGKG
jgi:hypothetical protein